MNEWIIWLKFKAVIDRSTAKFLPLPTFSTETIAYQPAVISLIFIGAASKTLQRFEITSERIQVFP